MTDSKKASELVAELAEAVKEMPDDEVAAELRALREEVAKLSRDSCCNSHCHGHSHAHCNWGHCWCSTWHYVNTNTWISQPYTITVPMSTATTISMGTSISSGGASVYTVI